jgi:hypothetical protein
LSGKSHENAVFRIFYFLKKCVWFLFVHEPHSARDLKPGLFCGTDCILSSPFSQEIAIQKDLPLEKRQVLKIVLQD